MGNIRFLKRFQLQISRAMREGVEEREMMGETALVCGWDGQAKGLISFADAFRTDVKPMLDSLSKQGIKPIMITGDQGEAIAQLTYAHGLHQIYDRCLPEEKISKIKKQQWGGKIVGLVGSPRNEGPALAQADVGMIIGAGTRRVASAPVSFLGEKFSGLTTLLTYAQKVASTITASVTAALLTHAMLLSLAFFGFIHLPGVAAASCLMVFWLTVFPLRLKKWLDRQSPAETRLKPDLRQSTPLPEKSLPSHPTASALPG